MHIHPLPSASIASVSYDPDRGILEVEFRHGGIYHYLNVPEREARQFVSAPEGNSHGKHLGKYIRGKYPFQRME